MRELNEIVDLICEQIYHWVNKCGRSEDDLAEMVLEAEDMIMTDDEMMSYPYIGNVVKGSIIL